MMHLKSIHFSTEDLSNGEGISATHPMNNERCHRKKLNPGPGLVVQQITKLSSFEHILAFSTGQTGHADPALPRPQGCQLLEGYTPQATSAFAAVNCSILHYFCGTPELYHGAQKSNGETKCLLQSLQWSSFGH